MKRSEMTKDLFEFIDENLHIDVEKEDVEAIIEFLERKGMLPPRIDFMIGEWKASDNAWESEE